MPIMVVPPPVQCSFSFPFLQAEPCFSLPLCPESAGNRRLKHCSPVEVSIKQPISVSTPDVPTTFLQLQSWWNFPTVIILVVWNWQIDSHRASNRSTISSSRDSHRDISRHIIAVNSCWHIPGSSGFRYHSFRFINSIDLEGGESGSRLPQAWGIESVVEAYEIHWSRNSCWTCKAHKFGEIIGMVVYHPELCQCFWPILAFLNAFEIDATHQVTYRRCSFSACAGF